MPQSIKKIILPHAIAIAMVAVATVILYAFRDQLNTSTVALLYLLPVLISTTLWGLSPGILASLLTFLSYNYFFLLPYYTFVVHESQDIIALGIFLVVAFLISQLVGRAKEGLEAALAREEESTRLYELSIGLTGVNDLNEIALVIARESVEAFQAEEVEVAVENVPGEKPFMVQAWGDDAERGEKPVAVMPLETVRGLLGEIRFWRDEQPLSPTEERLLHTFAAQGALALERAALAHAETRAKALFCFSRISHSTGDGQGCNHEPAQRTSNLGKWGEERASGCRR